MSNVLILFSQHILDEQNPDGLICFYEGFSSELCKNGNNVKFINLRSLETHTYPDFITNIRSYKPDIIFTFNNRINEDIINSTDCPICIMNADGFDFWTNLHLIQKNSDRYYLFSFWKGWEQDRYESLNLSKNRIVSLHMATSLQSKNMVKTTNISFIGSLFSQPNDETVKLVKNNTNLQQSVLQILYNGNLNLDCFLKQYRQFLNTDVVHSYSLFDPRLLVLRSVTDLGLDLYGIGWNNLSNDSVLLKFAYKNQPVYTVEDNERIYNSSHINLSISHPQCNGYAFPWRVFDIMASNGVLIASYSELLENLTKGLVKIPMFKSPYDARDLCKYALKNPHYCEEIVEKSHAFIEKYGRWQDNLQKIQDITKVKLIFPSHEKGSSLEIVCIIDNQCTSEKNISVKYLLIKKRIKLFFYLMLLMLAQIPILDLLLRKKTRVKLRKKIEKWWR